MITSKDVLGPSHDDTITKHVYAALVDKKGKLVSVTLLHPVDQTSFDLSGRIFERTKERDEFSRIVFKEASAVQK